MQAAFQGVPGAYSELACKQLLGQECRTLACEAFQGVFDAVEAGRADLGVIPIENSLAGSIHQNYDLLLSRDLHIVGEAYLKVEHMLLCHPQAALADLTEVRSHPQALAQCARFFARNKRVKPVVYFDTAGAAQSLARAPRHVGAIASAYAGKLYGLKVARRNLQDRSNNFTRFLAVAREPFAPTRLKSKTSLVFMPARNHVGVLHRILGIFAEARIDLLKIESRPNPFSPFEYWFYADLAGGAGEAKVDKALGRLQKMVSRLKLLGSYPRAAIPAAGRSRAAATTPTRQAKK